MIDQLWSRKPARILLQVAPGTTFTSSMSRPTRPTATSSPTSPTPRATTTRSGWTTTRSPSWARRAALNSALFFKGAAAHDSNDYIIYNSATGKLYYDDDGTGSHAQVEICTITNKANISAGDFTVMA